MLVVALWIEVQWYVVNTNMDQNKNPKQTWTNRHKPKHRLKNKKHGRLSTTYQMCRVKFLIK
jgi:hypothetical protein